MGKKRSWGIRCGGLAMIGASRLWRARAWPEERLADILLKLHAGTAGPVSYTHLTLPTILLV
eukprot:1918125-Amphidinium_carterae.1